MTTSEGAGTPATRLHGQSAVGAWKSGSGVAYCVWAPDHFQVTCKIERQGEVTYLALSRDDEGYWRGWDPGGRAGDLYQYRLPDGRFLPDIASRFQPQGVHGPSECIDSLGFNWEAANWTRPAWNGQSIYEIHVGTFSAEGTFRAAIPHLASVRDLGFEAIQLMPVGDFPGERNWGYDGVMLFAPARCYGRPDDLRALIDAAHRLGLAVILDVVYNHLGPAGNYLPSYSREYFSGVHHTPWGTALNLDGPRSGPVRELLLANAAYWLDEFRIDGLRLDATHCIPDDSRPHLLAEIAQVVHIRGGFVIAEDDRNSVQILNSTDRGGYGFDAAWSDDFHHQTRVGMTGSREAYFASYGGTPSDLADTLEHGWAYRGQPYPFWKGKSRGSDCDHLPAKAFVFCIENHDQVGNRALGERLAHLVTPAQFRAASLLLCLSPYAPMVFMGQEWGAASPFMFFTDHDGELGRQVSAGRLREFEQSGLNAGISDPPDPQDRKTFLDSKLKWEERDSLPHRGVLSLYQAGLEIREGLKACFQNRRNWSVQVVQGVVAIRLETSTQRFLVLTSLGDASSDPLLEGEWPQPPTGCRWRVVISSDEIRFGGSPSNDATVLRFLGPRTVLFEAVEESSHATL